MDINELKSSWKNAGVTNKTQAELQKMTLINSHPQLKKLRTKFIIEVIALILFLATYYDAFDGIDKPLWLNGIFVASTILYVANNVVGYLTLLNPIQGNNLVESLKTLEVKLSQALILSITTSLVFAIAFTLFMSVGVQFATTKYLLLMGLVLTGGLMTYGSFRIWSARLRHVRQFVSEFNESAG